MKRPTEPSTSTGPASNKEGRSQDINRHSGGWIFSLLLARNRLQIVVSIYPVGEQRVNEEATGIETSTLEAGPQPQIVLVLGKSLIYYLLGGRAASCKLEKVL